MIFTLKAFLRGSVLPGYLNAGSVLFLTLVLCIIMTGFAGAQESQQEMSQTETTSDATEGQDRETKALDSTATQWSFQFGYQVMPDYHDDILDNGQVRPEGNTDYLQLRIVAPVPLKSFTILPRLTLRHYENA
ncbi:MAG: hypothetical protein AMK69_21445, partial [Nitrospira bacterium SG8_3]